MCANIIFDADDTLWKTEELYDRVRDEFADMLVSAGLGPKEVVISLAKQIDLENEEQLGLAKTRFPNSLVKTYERRRDQLQEHPVQDLTREVQKKGEEVFRLKAELYANVADTLQALALHHKLFLWTQGDESVQLDRLEQSGLEHFFEGRVKVAPKGTAYDIRQRLTEWNLASNDTWIVGNSLNSEVNPAVEAGLNVVWIPAYAWDEATKLPEFGKDLVYLLDKFENLKEIFVDPPPPTSASAGEAVYLFVSAYHTLYRQYVLDILASPRNYVMSFPYRTAWLPGEYRCELPAGSAECNKVEEFRTLIEGKRALIVFTDERVKGEPRRSPHFLPIRAAQIVEAKLHGELIQISFKMGAYVSAVSGGTAVADYDKEIRKLVYRPQLDIQDCAYIALGPDWSKSDLPIRVGDGDSQDDAAWESVARVLGDLRAYKPFQSANLNWPAIPNPFQFAMFYRVMSLENLKTGAEVGLVEDKGNSKRIGECAYDLKSDSEYRLNLLFFCPKHPETKVRLSKLQVELAPAQVLSPISSVQIPLNFSYDNRQIDFATVRSFVDAHASISFSLTAPAEDDKVERTQVMTPAPLLSVRVQADKFTFLAAAAVFLIGGAIGSLSDPLSKVIAGATPSLQGSTDAIHVMLGIVGSFLTTGVLYFLYRTLK